MRLTTKGRFAVTAMVDLALRQNRGPVTLAARMEQLDYDSGRFSRYSTRGTVGMRVQLTQAVAGQVNVMKGASRGHGPAARTDVDAALTWVLRVPR